MRNFFRMQQAEKCPVCKEDWPGDMFVGEKAITANPRSSHAVPRVSSAAPSDLGVNPETDNDDNED